MARWKSTNRTAGRTAPISSREQSDATAAGRVTPRTVRPEDIPSPPWLPITMGVLFALGVMTIVVNYLGWWPGGSNNGYLGLGLLFVLAGTVLATRWR